MSFQRSGARFTTPRHEVLAQNVPVATIVADGTLINNNAALIPLLAASLHVPPNEIAEKIASRRPYIVLKREFPDADARGSRENLAGQEPARHSVRTRYRSGLSERADALPRHRLRGFSSAWDPGRGSVDGSIFAGGGRLSLHRARRAGSRDRRSIAGWNVRRATAARST